MIIPTVGRAVWYRPSRMDYFAMPENEGAEAQPLAATVTYVHSNTLVNLVVFDVNGAPHGKSSVYLYQGGENDKHPAAGSGFCEWMPYQKAVAKGDIAPTRHAQPPEAPGIMTASNFDRALDDRIRALEREMHVLMGRSTPAATDTLTGGGLHEGQRPIGAGG